ncbi:MAG: hypothetical protein JWO90_3108, partial [Solirubrobacterales bacterium]|nr:hypothetical protein [Solirubrobacterales bacterium]
AAPPAPPAPDPELADVLELPRRDGDATRRKGTS